MMDWSCVSTVTRNFAAKNVMCYYIYVELAFHDVLLTCRLFMCKRFILREGGGGRHLRFVLGGIEHFRLHFTYPLFLNFVLL